VSEELETRTIQESLGTLIDYRGKTPPKTESGVRLVTAKVIKGGYIQDDKKEFIAADFYDEWMRRGLPKQWDIVITTEAPLGEVAQLRTAAKVALAQRVILLRTNPDVYDQSFFFQALKGHFVQGELKARGTGTTVLGIKQSELRKVRVPWFPLPTQRKIASILSAYDDLIENNTRRIAILEEMAQAIYREWFVNFRFPGHENVKLVDSPLGQIPEGWEVGTLDDLTTFSNGFAFKSKELRKEDTGDCYHVFKMGQIVKGGGFDSTKTKSYIEREKCSTLQKYILRKGDLLMCMTDMKASVALLGHTALMNEDEKYIQNQRVGLVRANNEFGIDFPYLYLLTNSEQFIDDIRSRANSGVQVNLSTAEIRKTKVVIPPKSINEKFDKTSKRIRQLVTVLQFKNRNLRTTRDLLLPKLISGKLDVEDLDIDVGMTAEALEEATA
jgi:type I restriction enzyme S subunit